MSAFTSLRRDFDVEHQLYEVGREACGGEHPLMPENARVSAGDASSSAPSAPSASASSSTAPAPEEEKVRGDGAVLVDPLSDPLSGRSLGGGDFDPLGVMGGGEAPTLNTPSPGAAGAQDESKKSTSSASSSANAAAEGKGWNGQALERFHRRCATALQHRG